LVKSLKQVFLAGKEQNMGINRWQGGIEERKRNEKEAKAAEIDEEIHEEEGKKGGPSSRLEGSEEPEENPEKRRVIEKLKEREQED
jgi:hypothetical protein